MMRQSLNMSQNIDQNFQCHGCPMDIMCAFSQCDRGNTLFCLKCIQQKHENCNDHKWDQFACQITNWTDMIQDLKEKSYNELENSAVITAYEQLEVMKSTLVNAIENMQQKIIEYCPSIKAYAKVYSYKPDQDFITNFTLRKQLVFDSSKQSLNFRHPINSENVDFPHILTRKIILQAQDLQRNFSHQCKKFLMDIEEVDPSFQKFRNTLRGVQKLAIKDMIKNQRAENYINESFTSKQEDYSFSKSSQNKPQESTNKQQINLEESSSYMLRSRNRGSGGMNLRNLPNDTSVLKNRFNSNNSVKSSNTVSNNKNNSSIYNYPRSQTNRVQSYNQSIESKEITSGSSLLNRKRRRFYREEKEERKLKILKDALKMGNILKAAKIHGVSGSVIRKWRKLYSGLPEIQEYNRIYQENRCAQEKYSAAEKKVILMELKNGSIKQSVANKYKIHPTTLRKWEKKFGKELGFKEFADSKIDSNGEGIDEDYYDVKEEYSDEEGEEGDIDGDEEEDDDGEEEEEIEIQIEQEDQEDDDDGEILDHQSLADGKHLNNIVLIKETENKETKNTNDCNKNNEQDHSNNNDNKINNSNNNNDSNQKESSQNGGEDKNKETFNQSQTHEKSQKKQQQQQQNQNVDQRSQMSLRARRQQATDSSIENKNQKVQYIDLNLTEDEYEEDESEQSVSQEVPNKELYKPHARFNKNLKIKEEDQSDSNQKRKTRRTVNQHL